MRRAFLCGIDHFSGKSYEHRRAWIADRIRVLSSVFSPRICAYAVMSNHYHLVVKLNPKESDAWTDDAVLTRWTTLFKGPLLVQRYLDGESLTEPEFDTLRSMAAVYRARLGNLSWFMKCLNEPIARQANAEDRCTGHFWEARFHSQALLSEQALLRAMVYVDINPLRAKMAQTPEDADYTSVKARLEERTENKRLRAAIATMLDNGDLNHFPVNIRPLMPFSEHRREQALPIAEKDYLQLLDQTGRIARSGKHGNINATIEPILDRLGLSTGQWTAASTAGKSNSREKGARLSVTS